MRVRGSLFVDMASADGDPELGLDGLGNLPVGAALAEAVGGDQVAGDLEFEVGVGAAVGRTGYPEAVSGDLDVGQDGQLVQAGVWVGQSGAIYAICGWSFSLSIAAARGPTLGPSGESGPLEILDDHSRKPVLSTARAFFVSTGPAIELRAGGDSELNTRRWLVPGRRTPLSSFPISLLNNPGLVVHRTRC